MCSPCVSLQSSDATSDLLLRAASRAHRQRKRDPHPRQSRLNSRKVGLPSSPRTPVGHTRYDSQTSFENFTSDYFNLEFSNLARSYISDPTIREEVQNVIDEECDWLKDFLGRTKHQVGYRFNAEQNSICLLLSAPRCEEPIRGCHFIFERTPNCKTPRRYSS